MMGIISQIISSEEQLEWTWGDDSRRRCCEAERRKMRHEEENDLE